MELIRGVHNFDAGHRGCVATIGNFDGVHLGHRAVLAQLAAQSAEAGLPSVVVVFEPQPQEFFQPQSPRPRLSRWREKFELVCEAGVDRLVLLKFDADLAATSAEDFVRGILVEGLGVRRLVIGDDFHFGRGRGGNFVLLETLGAELGFTVLRAETYIVDGERVSSTRIRDALQAGDLELARRLLGRHYSISGRVVHGDKRGRSLGFPTANIELHRRCVALRGIFAARVGGLADEKLPAAAYVGPRPAVGGTRDLLEVHVLDYDGDCYGRHLTVEFLQRLRADQDFQDLSTLRSQIARDVSHVRDVLDTTTAGT